MTNVINEDDVYFIYEAIKKTGFEILAFKCPKENELPDSNGRYLIIYKANELFHFNFKLSAEEVSYSYFPTNTINGFAGSEGNKPRKEIFLPVQQWLKILKIKLEKSKALEEKRAAELRPAQPIRKAVQLVEQKPKEIPIDELPVRGEELEKAFSAIRSQDKLGYGEVKDLLNEIDKLNISRIEFKFLEPDRLGFYTFEYIFIESAFRFKIEGDYAIFFCMVTRPKSLELAIFEQERKIERGAIKFYFERWLNVIATFRQDFKIVPPKGLPSLNFKKPQTEKIRDNEKQTTFKRRVAEVFGSTYQLLLNEIEKAGYKLSDFQLPQMELIDITKNILYYKHPILNDSEFGFRFKPDDSDIVYINVWKEGNIEIKDLEISRINLPEHFRDWIKRIKEPVKKNSTIEPKSEPTEKPLKRKIFETILLGAIKWAVVALLSYIASQGLKPLYAAIVIALLIIIGLVSKKIGLLIDHYFPK